MNRAEKFYQEEAAFLLRENMNKLKGLIELLSLGALDGMNEEEKDEFISKINSNMNSLYRSLEESILRDEK